MADDLSLLFKLRGDASGLKTATAEGRAAVNQLRQSFGPELTQTVTVANRAFSDIADNLNVFVGQRIPLVGGAFVRITENLRGLGQEGPKVERALAGIGKSIQSIATESGKSTSQITAFLARFALIEGQAKRDKAAIDFFGASLGAKLVPELEKTGTALAAVSAESAAAGVSLGALALPVAIAAAEVVLLTGGLVLLSRELFTVSKRAAEAQGRMFDLSQQTGVAVETLSALEIVAKTTGGEIGNLTNAIITFQRRLDDTSDPNSKAAAQFKELGVAATDTETALRQTFAALARMPQGFQQTNAAAELFGARGGKQLLAILKETNGDLDGAIRRFRELGILISEGDARAADRLNDELALLDFQLRSLGFVLARDIIPELTGLVKAFSDVVQAAKPLLGIVGSLAGINARALASSLRGLSTVVQVLTFDFQGLKRSIRETNEEAAKAKDIPALTTEGLQATSLPGQQTPQQRAQEEAAAADVVVASIKRVAATRKEALEQAFEQGRINRQQVVDDTIESNRQLLKAETDRIDALVAIKQKEFKAIDRERLSRAEVAEQEQRLRQEADKLNQERLDKEAEFERESTRLRARAARERADSRRAQIANETDLLVRDFEQQIKTVNAAIERGEGSADAQLAAIEALERAKADARIEGLEQQKRVGFLTIEEAKDLDRQLQQLQQERDHLDEEQQTRRLARERATAERVRDIQLASLDALLEIEGIRAERLIAANEALAATRVQSEEETARRILAIRLRLIDTEVEATKARLTAAATIANVDERTRTEAELNNRLRVLGEQRVAITEQGTRDIGAARQQDLENERRHAEELDDLREEAVDAERDAAEEVIRLMEATFARRRDIIRAERDLELLREEDRHRRETNRISEQQRQVDDEIRLLEKRLERLKVGTTEEIEEHDRLIESLERLRLKRAELERQQEAEDERSEVRRQRVTKESTEAEEEADPFGRIKVNVEDIRQITSELEASIVPMGEILSGTFNQVADAIGQVITNWVLLGETGPAVMRKILAVALATIAREAAVNAVKELALGFATLFLNPAASAGHFAAAALWGSIAGVSAIAGRAVAGDLFKPKTAGTGTGGGGRGSTSSSGERDPIDLIREQMTQELHVFVHTEPGGRFNEAVVVGVVDNVRTNGPMRTVIKEVGKD